MYFDKLYKRSAEEVRDFNLDELHQYGLERTLDSYYLMGTYPPILAMQETSTSDDGFFFSTIPTVKQPVDLYVHFPFCRVKGNYECSFCHFYKETHESEHETNYLTAATKEMMMYKERMGSIDVQSIYFGGGSFSLITPENLERLFEFIYHECNVEPSAEIKFEIHADAGKEPENLKRLLHVLKKNNVTDIVIDIQTLNPLSLKAITWSRVVPEDYLATVEQCTAFGFDNIVTGLIIGLPFDNYDMFMQTLIKVVTIPQVKTINLFPLMFREGDAVYQQRLTNPELFPDVYDRDIMHHTARKLLEAYEFYESPIYFCNRKTTKPSHQTSKFESNSLLGIGPSSFGLLKGSARYQYYNTPSTVKYMKTINKARLPVSHVGVVSNEGWTARNIIFGCLNLNREFDLSTINHAYLPKVIELCKFLASHDLVRMNELKMSITEKGLLRAEEVSYYFAEEKIRKRLRESLALRSDGYRYNYFITRSAEQEYRFFHQFENG